MFGKKTRSTSSLRQSIGERVTARLEANPDIVRADCAAADVFYQLDFLSPAQCDALIARIDADRRPSTLLSDKSGPGFRTSESCDLERYAPEVRAIDEAIADLLGISYPQGETMQGQRYAVGQQFRAHHDFFHEGESYWQRMKAQGGQRTWTAMIYLNDVPDGGATWFPQAGIKILPRRGLLLTWNNMKPDGAPNELTLHEGMPVVEGVKYIVTKWFREGSWLKIV